MNISYIYRSIRQTLQINKYPNVQKDCFPLYLQIILCGYVQLAPIISLRTFFEVKCLLYCVLEGKVLGHWLLDGKDKNIRLVKKFAS